MDQSNENKQDPPSAIPENFYTDLETAKALIWERWNDPFLRTEVKRIIGNPPSSLQHKPRAVLVRNIATPDNELIEFLHLAKDLDLEPIVFEFMDDIFIKTNPDKLSFGKLNFFQGKNDYGQNNYTSRTIIDTEKAHGTPFGSITTFTGQSLVEFHHQLIKNSPCHNLFEIDEISWFIRGKMDTPKEFYFYLLALFLIHGVLFEDYYSYQGDRKFTRKVVEPAFKKINQLFKVNPIIVRLPIKKGDGKYWYSYPGPFEEVVEEAMESTGVVF